jgi:hypothetical protein
MACHLSIIFADGTQVDYQLSEAEVREVDSQVAHAWLDREFENAGCVPANPVGKLLTADKILGLAKAQSPRSFDPPSPWIKDFLRATAAALARPVITIDLGRYTLGF